MSRAYRSPNSGAKEWSNSTRFGGSACATSAVARVSSSPQTNLAPKDGTVPSQPGIFRVSNDAATLADLARIMSPDAHPVAYRRLLAFQQFHRLERVGTGASA